MQMDNNSRVAFSNGPAQHVSDGIPEVWNPLNLYGIITKEDTTLTFQSRNCGLRGDPHDIIEHECSKSIRRETQNATPRHPTIQDHIKRLERDTPSMVPPAKLTKAEELDALSSPDLLLTAQSPSPSLPPTLSLL
ncbi:hypothetical protein BU17DRAFT_70695 [Hysterangium stoloniferum]|nr:hypothetical protein BU17DRAFT_70695 [Hysterangium stoloniferum]